MHEGFNLYVINGRYNVQYKNMYWLPLLPIVGDV